MHCWGLWVRKGHCLSLVSWCPGGWVKIKLNYDISVNHRKEIHAFPASAHIHGHLLSVLHMLCETQSLTQGFKSLNIN